jgi:hypothetical protein
MIDITLRRYTDNKKTSTKLIKGVTYPQDIKDRVQSIMGEKIKDKEILLAHNFE